jgi:hypothetical protein
MVVFLSTVSHLLTLSLSLSNKMKSKGTWYLLLKYNSLTDLNKLQLTVCCCVAALLGSSGSNLYIPLLSFGADNNLCNHQGHNAGANGR